MDFLLQVLAWIMMVGIISLLVVVHECGHFLVARMFGFQTPVFGIGLPVGPFVVVGHKWDTQFRIHAALLGGYVAIPELGDESQHDKDAYGVELKPFKKFPIWQRALVAFAGVGFNILFAYLIMFMMLVCEGAPIYKTVIANLVKENPIAAKAGIKKGDILLKIDEHDVASSEDAVKYLGDHKLQEVVMHVTRDDKPVDIKVTTNPDGKVGMVLDSVATGYQKIDKSIPEIGVMAGEKLWDLTNGMMKALGMIGEGIGKWVMSGGKPATGSGVSVGPGDVHGILAVMKLGADIAKEQNWNQLFLFTILISMDLAIINLLPWPALDGGHLAFMAVEAIRGKPMGEKAQGEIFRWGLLSLLLLMVVIMVNDVTALFQGKLDLKKAKQEQKMENAKDGDKPAAPSDAKPTDNASSEANPASTDAAPADGTTDKSSTDKPADATTSDAEQSKEAVKDAPAPEVSPDPSPNQDAK